MVWCFVGIEVFYAAFGGSFVEWCDAFVWSDEFCAFVDDGVSEVCMVEDLEFLFRVLLCW